MKIALIGSKGNVGRIILKESLLRGHEVTAIVRNLREIEENQVNLKFVEGDIFDEEKLWENIIGNDIVISAFGPKYKEERTLLAATKSLINAAKKSGVPRILSIGGAGSLITDNNIKLSETSEFPKEWQPIALAHGEALDYYRQEKNINWTNISPAAILEPGIRTGIYKTSENKLITDGNGESHISIEDLAFAILEEVEKPKFSKKRFTVGY